MRHFRIGLTTALAVYAIAMLASPDAAILIDAFNQPVHEAGHVLFSPFGTEAQLLGGTFLQLFLPLLLGAWFTVHKNEYAASVAAWWVGQSFTTIGLTMAHSSATLLPLPGADRDWSILFAEWGVAGQALQYGQLAHGFGFLIMLVATYWGLIEAFSRPISRAEALPRYRSMARR